MILYLKAQHDKKFYFATLIDNKLYKISDLSVGSFNL